ncbi:MULTISPECIES: hypothetical protein [unclassified Microcoleus]|uniref:hypothetical protein n=1 Tax=unclassified Microcoleus TaxID=2642155 RepID=UPI002FD6B575
MPGRKHETAKQRISTLVDLYLEYAGIDFTPTGSVTLESETGRVKREADLSYELGANRERPDLAVEVVVTSGGIDKLEACKRLEIPEGFGKMVGWVCIRWGLMDMQRSIDLLFYQI